MRHLIATASLGALALALSACGGPEAEEVEERESAETGQAARTGDGAGEPAEPAPEPAPVASQADLAVAEEARECAAAAESAVEFTAPERGEEESDAVYNNRVAAAFLEMNAERDCVFTLDSGLQFTIVNAQADEALSPQYGDQVTVHYEGRLIDGSVFDSSYERGEPATFPSDRLIQGWVQALPLMRVGEEWTLFIPPGLAYGLRGTPGGPIGPNEALIFRIELLDIPQGQDEGGER